MLGGICFLMHGGWLEWACAYNGLSLGLRYGQYLPEGRIIVTSRESACTRFASVVIFISYF